MTDAHLTKIRSRGYWRVVIRPLEFAEKRVENIIDLKRIVEANAVNLRGWDFPHIDTQNPVEFNTDYVSQDLDWDMYVEHWRCYQSGQFLHLHAFSEDWVEQAIWRTQGDVPKPGESLWANSTIFRFAEIFEFAARLSLSDAGSDGTHISISLFGLAGRQLWQDSPRRMGFFDPHRASIPEFSFSKAYSQADLVANPRELALEPTVELLRRFGWDPKLEIIREVQTELRR